MSNEEVLDSSEAIQKFEELKVKHKSLDQKRISFNTKVEQDLKLESQYKAEALAKYGVSTAEELSVELEKRKKDNSDKVRKYRTSLIAYRDEINEKEKQYTEIKG